MNSKGQAALTDSLFFLAIVAAITAMFFFYLSSYGDEMNTQLDAFYTKDFAADSLKVITYVNVMRDGTNLQEHIDGRYSGEEPQFDYLLTLMKEDYSDEQKFSGETVQAIALTLDSVLKPFNSVDYAFYLLSESESKFLFLMLSVHEGELELVDEELKKYDVVDVVKAYYSCEPINQEVLSKYITPYIGQVDQSKGKISFLDPDVKDSLGRPFIIGLDVWISKELPTIKALNPDLVDTIEDGIVRDNAKQAALDFNCSLIMECEDGGDCTIS